MLDPRRTTRVQLYFFCRPAAEVIGREAHALDPIVAPQLGPDWAARLPGMVTSYRDAVDLVIREAAETSLVLAMVEHLSRNLSNWRELAVSLARNAPKARQEVLLRAAGYGLGSPRSVKETKDVLITIKNRLAVHEDEFKALGMAPVLLELPGRVLTLLETGASDVAREKAEDSLARANLNELFERVFTTVNTVARAANAVTLQALLLADRDDASAEEKQAQLALVDRMGALTVHLEKLLAESKVQGQKRAAKGDLPPLLLEDPAEVAATEETETPGEEPAA